MTSPTGQKDRMLAGERYFAWDPELRAARVRAQTILARFNATVADADDERRALLTELFAHFGKNSILLPSLRCDYGFNITIGDRVFINYDCVLLDCNRISIGSSVMIAPGVHIYTASHPLEPTARRTGVGHTLPVTISDGVWLGGRAVICPGVTVGENTAVGAGSVVTRDLPANVVAAGNPCRVLRKL